MQAIQCRRSDLNEPEVSNQEEEAEGKKTNPAGIISWML